MPKLSIPFDIDIPPEKYLRNCSREELIETSLLLESPRYVILMHGTYTPAANGKTPLKTEFPPNNI